MEFGENFFWIFLAPRSDPFGAKVVWLLNAWIQLQNDDGGIPRLASLWSAPPTKINSVCVFQNPIRLTRFDFTFFSYVINGQFRNQRLFCSEFQCLVRKPDQKFCQFPRAEKFDRGHVFLQHKVVGRFLDQTTEGGGLFLFQLLALDDKMWGLVSLILFFFKKSRLTFKASERVGVLHWKIPRQWMKLLSLETHFSIKSHIAAYQNDDNFDSIFYLLILQASY